jgi:predicted deacylase
MNARAFELPIPDLTAWRAGNTGVPGVWRFDSGAAGPDVLVTALVHGNELCGAWAVRDLLAAGVRPQRGALTLALCNLAAFDTFDPARPHASRCVEHDLNRVWGDALHGPGATVEHVRARQLAPFVERADWLLDLHSMHDPGPPLLLTGVQRRNVELARTLGVPEHVVVDAGHAEGCRMRDHGRFGAADAQARALLIECGAHGALSSREVARDISARFLRASGCIETPAGTAPLAPQPAQQVLEVTHAIAARSPDTRFAEPWRCMQRIARAGTVLGWREGEPFVTPYDDCTLVMPSLRQLRAGVTVVRLARRA